MPTNRSIESVRGLPRWRQRQREMSVGERVEKVGRIILETRELERIKRLCRLSATSSSDLSAKAY